VTSAQSLLYAATSDVTIERVRTLVRQVGAESPTIEYKEQMCATIARGVAALGNTYGGLLLVGVTDDRIVRGVKEKTIESVADHCAAKIEPPWVPEIIAVPLSQGSDLYVLVLRVVPGHHARPLLVDGVAYIRHQNTTHPADWQRLRDLFAESAAALQDDLWDLHAPDLPRAANGAADGTVDFVLRSGLNVTVTRDAQWRPLSEHTVTAFTGALNRSPLNAVLMRLAVGGAPAGGMNPFHRQGLNRSRLIRLAWSGSPDGWPEDRPGPAEASVRLEVPGGYGHTATHLRVEADVVVRRSAAIDIARQQHAATAPHGLLPPHWSVPPQQLGGLIDAMLATLTGKEVTTTLADMAGTDILAIPQPRVMHIVTERPIPDVLDTTGLRAIPDAGDSRGAHLLADPALDLANDQDRSEQVRRWLIQVALDAGLTGMEQVLQRLTAPHNP
jgi:hypothetical protein